MYIFIMNVCVPLLDLHMSKLKIKNFVLIMVHFSETSIEVTVLKFIKNPKSRI